MIVSVFYRKFHFYVTSFLPFHWSGCQKTVLLASQVLLCLVSTHSFLEQEWGVQWIDEPLLFLDAYMYVWRHVFAACVTHTPNFPSWGFTPIKEALPWSCSVHWSSCLLSPIYQTSVPCINPNPATHSLIIHHTPQDRRVEQSLLGAAEPACSPCVCLTA